MASKKPDGVCHTSSRHKVNRRAAAQKRKSSVSSPAWQPPLPSQSRCDSFLTLSPPLINRLNNVHFATSGLFLFFRCCCVSLNASARHASSTLPFDPRTLSESCPNLFAMKRVGFLLRIENVENFHHTLLGALTSCTHETPPWQTTNFLFSLSSCGSQDEGNCFF